MTLLREFAEKVRRATDPDGIWQAAVESLPAIGFQMFCYYHFPPFGAADEHDCMVVSHGFPEKFVEAYFSGGLRRSDPMTRIARAIGSPFLWSEAGTIVRMTDDEIFYLRECRKAGLGDGLAIPVFGPGGRNAYASLGFAAGHERAIGPSERLSLQLAAQSAHLRYCELWNMQQPQPASLTPREREILKWVARGKSNSVISDIIGISSNTVDTHMRRIYSKLEVTDRVSAAIRGVGSGLVAA